MRIFCFGDSNTYGYDARSRFGERLSAGERWPEILGEQYGWEIQNEGMNGRKIPGEAWSLAGFDRALLNWGETDLLLIMLGTNDLLGVCFPGHGRGGRFDGAVCVPRSKESADRGEKEINSADRAASDGDRKIWGIWHSL